MDSRLPDPAVHAYGTRGVSTCVLPSLAFIALGGGLVGIPNAYLFDLFAVAAPAALGATSGFYVPPGLIAQAVCYRPGRGLYAQVLAGFVAAPFAPTGVLSVVAFALLGLMLEVPYAVLLDRRWNRTVAYATAVFVAAVYSALRGAFYNTPALGPTTFIGQPLILLLSMLFAMWAARSLTALLQRTGVLRGLQPPHPTRADTTSPSRHRGEAQARRPQRDPA